MNPAHIILYYRFRTQKEGTILTQMVNGKETGVKDIEGNLIKCVGTWLSPSSVEQCRSAVTAEHQARQQTGEYFAPRKACVEQ